MHAHLEAYVREASIAIIAQDERRKADQARALEEQQRSLTARKQEVGARLDSRRAHRFRTQLWKSALFYWLRQ
jgi:hypothetical protein